MVIQARRTGMAASKMGQNQTNVFAAMGGRKKFYLIIFLLLVGYVVWRFRYGIGSSWYALGRLGL